MSIKSRNLFYSFHIDGSFLNNTVWMIQSYFCGHNFKTVLSVSKDCTLSYQTVQSRLKASSGSICQCSGLCNLDNKKVNQNDHINYSVPDVYIQC